MPDVDRDVVVVHGSGRDDRSSRACVSQDLDPVAVGEAAHVAAAAAAGQARRRPAARCASATTNGGAYCERGFGAVLAAGLNRFQHPGEGRHRGRSDDVRAVSPSVVADRRSRVTSSSQSTPLARCDRAWGVDIVGPRRGRRRRRASTLVAERVAPSGSTSDVRSDAHRGRRSAAGRRHRRDDDPAGGVPRARRGVVHEGLLPRPGARVPHRHPRPRQPVPAAGARRFRCVAAGRRRNWWGVSISWTSHRGVKIFNS